MVNPLFVNRVSDARIAVMLHIAQSLSMETTRHRAAIRSSLAAVMAPTSDDLFPPVSSEEAVERAVKLVLTAASHLALAADLADEGDEISDYINTAIRLRDLANSLLPDRPDWPANVIPFVPRRA
jgi:hypothetical protein